MAENIRLQISLEDKASAELKRVIAAVKKLEGPIGEASFKWQYNVLRMQEAMQKFNASPMAAKMKELANHAKDAAAKIKSAWDGMRADIEKASGTIKDGLGKIGGMFKNLASSLTSMPAMIAGAVAGGIFGGAIKQGLEFNTSLETLTTQFGVLTGSAEQSGRIMREVVAFAAKTPFQMNEVATTARVMMTFGMQGREMLRRIGDAAAAANLPMQDVANALGRVKSGAFGEAFMRLAETGIATREMLEGKGLVFDKQGSYKGSADAAVAAIAQIIDERFSGMMDKLSSTMAGKMSTLKDDIEMTLGVITGGLFDAMKPALDRLSKAIQHIREGGVAQGIGAVLSDKLTPVVNGLIGLLEKPEKVFGWFVKAVDWVQLIFDAAKAGFAWLWDVAGAFFVWLDAKLAQVELMVMRMAAKIPRSGTKWGDYESGRLQAATDELLAARTKLDMALGKSGMAEVFRIGKARIEGTDYATREKAMMRRGSSTTAIVLGKNEPTIDPFQLKNKNAGYQFPAISFTEWARGMGKGAASAFARVGGGMGALEMPLGMGEGSMPGGWQQDKKSSIGQWGGKVGALGTFAPTIFGMGSADAIDAYMQQVVDKVTAARDAVSKVWTDYTSNLGSLFLGTLGDTMTTAILSKHEDLKSALNDVWQGMKANFVKMTVDMALAWAVAKIKMMAVERTAALASAGNTATQTGLDAVQQKSNIKTAVTGIWKAYSHLPFIGQVLAAAAVAYMVKSIGGFRTGGMVPGGGSGNEDNRTVNVSGGEGILNKPAVDRNGGRAFIDALNSGALAGGGGTTQFVFNLPGGNGGLDRAGLRRDIETEVVPILERLARQRRLNLGVA